MIPDATDIGKTFFFRVRASVAGQYSAYSNIVVVSVPRLNLTFNPIRDNEVC